MVITKTLESIKSITRDNDNYILTELHKTGIPNTNIKLKKDDLVNTVINDTNIEVSIEWLYCWLKLNCKIAPTYTSRVNDITFYISSLNSNDIRAYCNPPIDIYLNHIILGELAFRVIPYAPNYAIAQDSGLLDLKTGFPFYVSGNSRDAKRQKVILNNRTFYLDILVASVWCKNIDKIKNVYVEHIDGNIENNKASNLRWVADKTVPVKTKVDAYILKNLNTGTEEKFPSLTAAMQSINRSVPTTTFVNLGLDRPYIIKVEDIYYQLKRTDNELPWVTLEEAKDKYGRVYRDRYALTIEDTTNGMIYTYNTLKDISEFINNGIKYVSLNDAINDLKKVGKYRITKRMVNDCGRIDYIAYNKITKEVIYASSTTTLVLQCDVPKPSIRKSALHNGKYEYNNWVFKEDNGEDFESTMLPVNTPKEIRLIKDSNELIFNSLRAAARHLGVDKYTVSSAIKQNRTINGFLIKYRD
jgi:hypothetical protein|nr:MAG TPA: NUMOD1 domain protein [Caudoviricetes sp.]